MDKMMSSHNATKSVEFLIDFDIMSHLLKFPKNCIPELSEETIKELTSKSLKSVDILETLFRQATDDYLGLTWPENIKPVKKDTMYAGILLPFVDYEVKKKKRVEKAYNRVVLESFKKPKDSSKFIDTSLMAHKLFVTLVHEEFDNLKIGESLMIAGEY
jgi:hypothetical protein